jgi:DHA2 family multidrug resistance protein-like MFS transporter
MAGGFLIAAIGLAVLTQIDSAHGLAVVVVGGVILAFGLAPVIILSTDLIVGAAPPERAGSAAALSETAAELGGALGIALLGSVVTAIYRARTADLAASDIPAAAVAAARDTFGAAAEVARTLQPDLGTQLFEIARTAFTVGVQVGTVLSALLAAAAGILALIALRPAVAAPQ